MAGVAKLSVVFQSRVEMPTCSILCQAWSSKKAVAGSTTLNKLWQPNFPADQRKVNVSALGTNCRTVKTSEVVLSSSGPTAVSVLESSLFKDLVRAVLGGTPLQAGLQLGLTYRSEAISLKILESIPMPSPESFVTDNAVYYQLTSNTKIRIRDGNAAPPAIEQRPKVVQGKVEQQSGMSKLTSVVNQTFAGYSGEVQEALGVASLGLGCSHLLRSSEHSIATQHPSRSAARAAVSAALMRAPRGLILHGPPGTGKTTLMRALVAALGCNYIELSHSVLLSRFEGDAERTVTKVFREAAARAPCCILVDNMDLLCYSRTAPGASELQKRIVACLLTLMDGIGGGDVNPSNAGEITTAATSTAGVFVIGTTARVADIDAAVRRAGRIDKEIEINVPSAPDREKILWTLLEKAGVSLRDRAVASGASDRAVAGDEAAGQAPNEAAVRAVAQLAHGMVGSDLLSVVKEAFYLTLRDNDPLYRIANVETQPQAAAAAEATATMKLAMLPEARPEGDDQSSSSMANLADEFAALDVEDEEADASSRSVTAAQPPASTVKNTPPNVIKATLGTSIPCPDVAPVNPAMPRIYPTVTESALRRAVSRVSPSALREVVIEVPCVRWTDIGGMDGVKQSLKEVVEWPLQRPELFASLGISPPKGVLLYGPPGCSKTLMAKALATESSMNFLAVRGPELLSKWLGESEKAVQALFRRARAAAPSIVFFDEIDALAGKRGDVGSGVSDRVLSQLLTELDGVNGLKQVIVIAATNRPDMLDAALIRPGRIDRKIYVPPPDEGSRLQILQLELKKMPLEGEFDYAELVLLTAGYSGAEIVGACTESAMLAIEAQSLFLRYEHLLAAIAAVKPQITESMLQFYRTCAAKL